MKILYLLLWFNFVFSSIIFCIGRRHILPTTVSGGWVTVLCIAGWSGGSIQQSAGVVARPTQQQIDSSVAAARQRQQYQQQQQVYNNNNSWENSVTNAALSDQFLSDILDQVIDIVPDAIATGEFCVACFNCLVFLGDWITQDLFKY